MLDDFTEKHLPPHSVLVYVVQFYMHQGFLANFYPVSKLLKNVFLSSAY